MKLNTPRIAPSSRDQRTTRSLTSNWKRIIFSFLFASGLATASFAQNVTVSGSTGANGSYATLKAAFDAINTNTTQTGNTIAVSIVADTTETASAVLNQPAGGSWAFLTISPIGGVRAITGSIAGPLIDLNGADNVTINGTGGLTIENTLNAATPSTIRFINDATNNSVGNCNIKGSGTSTTLGTIFFSTGTTTGNDGNNITSNNITSSGATFATNAIFSLGTSAGIDNSGNTISGNNISDYFNAAAVTAGINLGATGNSAWTITNNKLFQTATRIYTTGNTHNGINIGVGSVYTISGNTIGFANSSGTGTTNMVGNSVALTGTFPSSYTTTGTATATRYIAINCAFTAGGTVSSIQSNVIAGIALYTSSGASTANGILCGINVTSGNANIGTTTGNTIGATSGGGGASAAALYAANTAGAGAVVGVFATSTNTVTIQNNTIGFVDSVGTTTTLSGAFTGIDTAGTGGVFNISSNTIGNTTANNIRVGYTLSAGNLSNAGTITSTTGTTSPMTGIRHAATGATVTINSNKLQGWQNGTTTGGQLTGVTSTGSVTTSATINNNQLGTSSLGWVTYTFANTYTTNTALGINLTGAGTATTHSIQSNDLRGITFTAAGLMDFQFITISGATAANDIATIGSNTFTNLNINTSGTITFISHNYAIASTGQLIINNNSIVTGFTRGSAGPVYITITNSLSGTGSINNYTNNNFSNITLTGSSGMVGFNNTDGGTGSTKTITGNTFNNWSGTTNTINVMNFTYWNGTSSLSGNTITNITGQSSIVGITIGSTANNATSIAIGSIASPNTITGLSSTGTGGSVTGITCANTSTLINISGNIINTLSSTGASSTVVGIAVTGATTTNVSGNTINTLSSSGASSPVVNGLSVSSGTTINVSKNKIYDLSQSGAISSLQPAINGMLFSGGTTVNAFNNLIGDLRTPAANLTDAIRGIHVTGVVASTTYNVSFNTVYLNASSTGANFGTTGVFHTTSATSTTATLNLRDNAIVNLSTPAGTGLTVAYRRSSTDLTNYGSASNNNDFYAGAPSASRLIFNNGTNSDQTIAAFKTRVGPTRESASFSENPPFLSTTGSSANFLHINTATATQLESGGITISGITDDFDGNTRNASTPDVGADEFAGTPLDLTPPTISYAALGNGLVAGTRGFTNVTVTDASGVNTTSGTRPRVYYKRSTDANAFNDNTNGTAGWKFVEANGTSSPFDFTIDYSKLNGGTGVAVGNTVQYFVVAQDLATTPNVGINSGTFATTPSSVALTSAAFPIGGTINSYAIVASISGTFNVGTGQTYATLTAAVADLNSKVINGPVVFLLKDASNTTVPDLPDNTGETFPIVINANPGSSATNTVTIKPDTGVIATISGSSASAIIQLNGASYITIDGSNSGSSLTIVNTNTSSGTAGIWLASLGLGQGATNNNIQNLNIIGGSNTTTTYGIVLSGSTVGASGADNDNNQIFGITITKVFNGIAAFGSAATSSGGLDGLSISSCTIGPSTSGVDNIGGNGIFINNAVIPGLGGNTVQNVSNSTASATPVGIALNLGVSNAPVVSNVVRNITASGSSATAYGVFVGSTSTSCQISSNSISNVTASNATSSIAVGASIGGTNNVFFGNGVVGVTASATSGSGTAAYGVLVGNTGTRISHTFVRSIINASTAGYPARGIYVNTGATSSGVMLDTNEVTDIQSYSDTSTAFSFQPVGIMLDGTTGGVKLYFNSVNLSGSHPGLTGATLQAALFVGSSVTAVDLRDNVFANSYDNSTSSTDKSYAIYSAAANTAYSPINYNDYYASGASGVLGFLTSDRTTIGAWQTATGQDANSIASDPLFNSATNLQPQVGSPVLDAGVSLSGVVSPYSDIFFNTRIDPPSMGAYENGSDTAAPVITYAPFANTISTSNRTLTATITDASGVAAGANLPRIYFKKSTGAGYVSTQCSLASGNAQNGTYSCTVDYSLVGGGSAAANDIIQYFVVAQDTLGNLGSNPSGATGANVNSITFSGTPNSYTILASISGTFTVGAGGNYATLTGPGGAITALNNSVITGPVVFNLVDATYNRPDAIDSTETYPITINANSGSSSTNTVTIKPASANSPTMSASNATAIFDLNGASYVIIDGSNTIGGTTKDLTIANTNTGGAVVRLINGASNNRIMNCVLSGASTSTSNGVVFFSTSTSATGQSNNTVSNNTISGGGAVGVNLNGTSSAFASNNIIYGNDIRDFSSYGVYQLSYYRDTTIAYNLVHEVATQATGIDGIRVDNASTATRTDVAFNYIYDLKTSLSSATIRGVYYVNGISSGGGDVVYAHNNIITLENSSTAAGATVSGIDNFAFTGNILNAYFNSIRIGGTGATGGVTAGFYHHFSATSNFKDNAVHNARTGTGTHVAAYVSSSNVASYVANYNDLFGPAVGYDGSTTYATLAAWRTYSSEGINSLSANPQFKSASDLHILRTAPGTLSPVENVGTPIPDLTTDFDGDTRDASTPDIGVDEVTTMQFEFAAYQVAENDGGGVAVISVTRTAGSNNAATINYLTSNGTATGGASCSGSTDYVTTSGTLNFAAGETSKTFNVPICNDSLYENNETVNLTLNTPTGSIQGAPDTAVLTIIDDDTAPTLSINNVTVNEGAGTADFTVTQSAPSGRTTTFRYDTADGSAVAPDDYTAVVNGMGMIPAGSTTTTVSIPINNDTTYEGDETFTVTLSNQMFGANHVSTPSASVGTATIQDNDAAPTVQFSSATYSVNENGGMVTITVTKTGATALPASVHYATSNGTATSTADYTSTSGDLNFAANDTSMSFNVPINNDGTFEGNEDFTVTLTSPSGATLGTPSSATVTIIDDDALPLVQFSASNYNVNEGDGTVTVTVTKTGTTVLPSTVNYATSDGSATQPGDYTQTSGMLTFLPNDTSKSFTVPISPDTVYEGNEQFTVTLNTPVGASLGSPNPATVTILEDDAAPVFTINDVSQNEGDAGQTSFSFTVTKTGSTAVNATVDYATADGTAMAPGDYTAIPTTGLTFLPNETTKPVTVLVNGDTASEANETFFVNLSNAANASISDSQGAGTITNDDCLTAPNTVYVDDSWIGTTPGTDPDGAGPATSFGCDSFATVEGGVNAVAPGGTVIVYAGNYVLATNVAVNKSVSIQGPNIGLSPRNGGGSRGPEAIVNGNAGTFNGSSGKFFNITAPATAVTISGFKFTNFDGNVIAEAGGAGLTNVDLHQNIFDTNNGGLMYKFNLTTATTVSFTDNRVANQSMTGINTALLFMGKLTNSHFDNNEASNISSRELVNLYDSLTNTTISNNNLSNTAGLALLAANQNMVTFDGNTITSTTTPAGVAPIYVSSNDGRTITNLAITNNNITTVTGGGIGIRVSTDTATAASITGVTISGNTISGTSAYGLDLDTFANTGTGTISNVNVQNNQFINNAFGPMLAYARPTSGTNTVSNLTLQGNTFTENAAIFGASFVQIDLRNISGTNTIDGNTYTLSGVLPPATTSLQAIGIRGNKSGTFNITNNNLDGGGVLHNGAATVFQSGIRIFSNDATTGPLPATAVINAQNNFIRGWEDGVVVRDGVAAVYGGLPAGITVKFNKGDLSGNSLKAIRSGTGELVDASINWWGTVSETAVAGLTSGGVDFTPYYNSGTDTNVAAGFQGDLSFLHVTALGAQAGATARIQEAINSVTSAGTVQVHNGTYAGNVDATSQSIVLSAGASPGQVTINGNLTLNGDDTVPIEINGTNAASDYDNFIVNGTVTLGGATLTPSGTHTPAAGQTFTIVDNDASDAVTGTFNGLPEGATFTFNGVQMRISYVGGSGNDVTLSAVTYTLTYTAGPNGSISGTSPQTVLAGGNGTPVTAVPNMGYHFVNWSDSSTANPRTDTNVMSNISVTANFAITNTPPTITTVPVSRQQGSPVSNSTIANVNDAESGPGAVVVTLTSANPSNGVTISNIVNTAGTVTADVVASCLATTATFTLQASDGSLTATDTLTVTVTANTAPTLTYNNASVAYNGSTTVNPASGPSDNGSVSTIVVQSTGTYSGTISVDNVTGIVSISNAAPIGSHTITIRATDNCGLITDATFTLTVFDTPPTITAAAGVTRQQGSPVSNSTIATVNDTESGAGAVVVTVTSANPSNGVTISNIVNTAGTVTANVVASCNATTATFTLQASDGSLTSTDTLTVTVTANSAPTLSYNNASVPSNGSTSVNPATGPSDNGSVSSIVLQSQGTYTGTISVDNVTGIVSISNAAPIGSHTITIRATDNCGVITDATFTLTVSCVAPNTVYVNASWAGTPTGADPDGAGPATSFGCDSFATIQDGVNGVANPGTVIVYAGTYPEAVTVNKSLTILGAQAGQNANTRFAAFTGGPANPKANPAVESILTAAATAPNSGTNDTLHVMANNVTFNGFVVDGNNPSLAQGGAVVVGGINTDSRRAIQTEDAAGNAFAVNNLTVSYNVIQNFSQRGVELINGTASNTAPATSGNVITQNRVRNFGLDGIVMAFNAYADVTFNTVVTNDSPTEAGIWVQDFLNTGTPHTMNITNNNVTVGQDNFGGIWVNLAYLAAVNINTNTVNAAAGVTSGDDFTYGIYVTSLRPGTTATLSGNIVGASGGQFDRGIALWNVGTNPTTTTVKDGSVKNSVDGISLVDNDANFGPAGASSAANVSGMTVSGSQVGVVVDANGSGASTVTMTITNSTLSGNTAATGGGITSIGTGGIASTTVTNSTLTKNSPTGAGILLQDASLTVGNSIFNRAAPGTTISALGSSLVTSLGYNLSRDNFGGFLTGTGDQINTDPILGPLKNNGGPTFTHAPLSNSPAIDRGKDLGPIAPAYTATGKDQRGSVRPVTYDGSITPPGGGDRSDIGAVELPPGVIPVSADSRKTHGGAGDFDIGLPFSGPVGVECRSGGANNEYQIIFSFAPGSSITFTSAAVTDGTGSVVNPVLGSGTDTLTVNLTGVTNAQRITLALFGVSDGVNSGDVGVRMGVLLGDVDGSANVNVTDVSPVKLEVGNPVGMGNFRTDVIANGAVNSTDVSVVKSKSGTGLPVLP